MKRYQTTSTEFSRVWRRGKTYTFPELRWLARRRGLDVRRHKKRIQLSGPKGVEAEFVELAEAIAPVRRDSTRMAALATLKLPTPSV